MASGEEPGGHSSQAGQIELSYCVVNTSQRELLVSGLNAIARERESLSFATEVLVLDNGSRDGSAHAAGFIPHFVFGLNVVSNKHEIAILGLMKQY